MQSQEDLPVDGNVIGITSIILFLLVMARMVGLFRHVQDQARQLDALAGTDGLRAASLSSSHTKASSSFCASARLVAAVHESGELGAVGSLIDRHGVGGEHRFEPFASVTGSVADRSEVVEVVGDLAFVPGGQDAPVARNSAARLGTCGEEGPGGQTPCRPASPGGAHDPVVLQCQGSLGRL